MSPANMPEVGTGGPAMSGRRGVVGLAAAILWGALLLGWVAWVWLGEGASGQELLANFAKAHDFFEGMRSVGGWVWWTPNFLGGTSLAFSWGYFFTNAWMLAWTSVFGVGAGAKLAALACLPIGAAGVHRLARRMDACQTSAILAAGLYFLMPGAWLRLAGVEHFVVLCALAVLPWMFFGIEGFCRRPCPLSALGAAAGIAALALTYAKVAALCLPVVLAFAAWRFARHHSLRDAWNPRTRITLLLGLFLLAGVPLLPSIRESGFICYFDFAPFDAWQKAFATRSALQLFDRGGWLSATFAPGFANSTGVGGFFVGSLALLALALAMAFRGRGDGGWKSDDERLFRGFAACTLVLFWMSFGNFSIVSAHFQTLRYSVEAPDWVPAAAWLLLVVQCWLIVMLVPGRGTRRGVLATLACAAYLFVPGFVFVDRLPLLGQLRAPFDFFQIPGLLFLALALGAAAGPCIGRIASPTIRASLLMLALALSVWDVSLVVGQIREKALPDSAMNQFHEAQEFLKNSPNPGSVQPLSGRYFYLLTPSLSGRPLSSEAFQSYLQQRGFAALLATASLSKSSMEAALRACGIAYFLSDEGDEFHGRTERERLPASYPLEFANAGFRVIGLPGSLGSAFVARDAVMASGWTLGDSPAVLEALDYSLLPIEAGESAYSHPEQFAGRISGGVLDIAPDLRKGGARPFLPVSAGSFRRVDYHRSMVAGQEEAGWMVLAQAWHPDWRAFVDGGSERQVFRAAGALPAIAVGAGEEIEWRFVPPSWYPACAWAALFAWGGLVAIYLVLGIAGFFRRSWKK